MKDNRFWQAMDRLAAEGQIVIDRPRGTTHPRWADLVYPLDYGYFDGTTAGDGDGIDVWVGSLGGRGLTGILCTYDTNKRDAEIKLLLGCTDEDVETILHFNDDWMRFLFIPRPSN
jgi:inorganic pyrophosphatase